MPARSRRKHRPKSAKRTTIIAFGNEKGGCGKTAAACNTAAALVRRGHRVLLIGLDTRGPLADDLGTTVPDDLPPLAEALKRGQLDSALIATPIPNLCLIPGDLSLDEQSLANEPLRDTILQRALQKLQQPFSFILLDTPPGLNLITLNAIMAADKLVIPCRDSPWAGKAMPTRPRQAPPEGHATHCSFGGCFPSRHPAK